MIIMNVWGVGKQEGWGREGDPPTHKPTTTLSWRIDDVDCHDDHAVEVAKSS